LALAEEIYRHVSEATSSGGPYAAIFDLSATKETTIPTNTVRSLAHRPPSVPMGRKQVVVGEEPVIFGLGRLFQMCRESIGSEFQIVHTLEEAYNILGVRPEDFTECLVNLRGDNGHCASVRFTFYATEGDHHIAC